MWMHHNGKDLVLGLIILIVTIWPTIFSATANMWIVIVAAALLVVHGLFCNMHGHERTPVRRRR